jgi:hypothetical protein
VAAIGSIRLPSSGRFLEQGVERGHAAFEPFVAPGELEPVGLFAARRDADAGDVEARQGTVADGVALLVRVTPGGQGQREGGDLDATGIEFEAVQVVGEHAVDGIAHRELFGGAAHRHQVVEGRDEEVAGTGAGVEQLELGQRVGPGREGSGGGCSGPRRWRDGVIRRKTQVGHFHRQLHARVAAVPPAAEGVFEQEGDHVLLGETAASPPAVRRRPPWCRPASSAAALLPSSAPARTGSSSPGCRRPGRRWRAAWRAGLRAPARFPAAVAAPAGLSGRKTLGSMRAGVVPGDFPFAAGGGIETLGGVFLAVGQADRVAVRVHQQIALGEEAGKEHAVPVLVGDLGDEVGDGLRVVGAQQIAQRTAMGTQAHAQLFLGIGGVGLGARAPTARALRALAAPSSAWVRAWATVLSRMRRCSRGSAVFIFWSLIALFLSSQLLFF